MCFLNLPLLCHLQCARTPPLFLLSIPFVSKVKKMDKVDGQV
jgi:hypothetical protein